MIEEIYLRFKDSSVWVSNHGNIKRVYKSKEIEMKKIKGQSGRYYTFTIYINSKPKQIKLHRAVAMLFIPVIEGKNIVNHIDGNRFNNHVSNLEWVNQKENMIHAHDDLRGKKEIREKIIEYKKQCIRKSEILKLLNVADNCYRSQLKRIRKEKKCQEQNLPMNVISYIQKQETNLEQLNN